MIKKLSRHGNSMALIIDKPILEILNITDETPLKISTDGKIITIKPMGSSHGEQRDESSNGPSQFKPDLTKLDF